MQMTPPPGGEQRKDRHQEELTCSNPRSILIWEEQARLHGPKGFRTGLIVLLTLGAGLGLFDNKPPNNINPHLRT